MLDTGSFEEWDMLKEHRCTDFGLAEQSVPGEGVVTGHDHSTAGWCLYSPRTSQTFFGGSLSESPAEKVCEPMGHAIKASVPAIGIKGSRSARIQADVASLGGNADVVQHKVMASGVIPE